MATATTYGTLGTEAAMSMVSSRYKPDATKPAVLYLHGRAATGTQLVDPNWALASATALAEGGYAVVSPLCGSMTNWGNDAAQTKVGDAKTYAQDTAATNPLKAKTGKVGLLGASMGGLLALVWALNNPTLVACVGLIDPVVDLAYEHDNNVGGLAAEIETAYTNLAGYTAAVAAHDPMQHTASYVGVPIKMWYSSDDTVAVTARQQAFIAATGCQSVALGAVGHSGATVDGAQVTAFFQANL